MDQTFLFSKESKIILYGAASIGHIMFLGLSEAGYQVIGFIDKRAEEIKEYLGRPVWLLTDVPGDIKNNPDTVVFVSVKNVFEHQTVAEQLTENGFYRIVYKPYHILIDDATEKDKRMDMAYEQIFQGHPKEGIRIDVSEKTGAEYEKDYAVCRQGHADTVALIPVDFIYTNDYHNTEMEKWGNVNILALFTHLQFFRFLQGDIRADESFYLNEYCVFTAKLNGQIKITDAWKKNVLRNRAQIYEEMSRALLMDREFFFRSPPQAVWNPKGYFNLTSGKHRTAFLVSRQFYKIPLKVTNQDYEAFLNKNCLQDVKKQILTKPACEIFVPHPYFYRTAGILDTYHYGVLSAIIGILSEKLYRIYERMPFEKLTILDETGDHGIFAAYFSRMGSRVIRKSFPENKDLSTAIWKLGHVPGRVQEYENLSQIREADVRITDLTNENVIEDADSHISVHDCFVICKEERQIAGLTGTDRYAHASQIFHTFQENGKRLLYWIW